MGSLVFDDIKDYLEVRIIDDNDIETIMSGVFPDNIPQHIESVISGHAIGSGLQSAVVDVSTYTGLGIPIKIKFILKGSGVIPTDRPGLLPDDDNPLGFPSTRGTSLLLDNIRLSGTGSLPIPIDPINITINPPSSEISTIAGAAGAVAIDGTVYLHGIQSGNRHITTATSDGSFFIDVPASSAQDIYYVLYYSTRRVKKLIRGKLE